MKNRRIEGLPGLWITLLITTTLTLSHFPGEATESAPEAIQGHSFGEALLQGELAPAKPAFQVFRADDGAPEIYTGSGSGSAVVANRFDLDRPTVLRTVFFFTSGASAGMTAEVVVYEDPEGASSGPDLTMEVWREQVVLEGGLQQVRTGPVLVNEAGMPWS